MGFNDCSNLGIKQLESNKNSSDALGGHSNNSWHRSFGSQFSIYALLHKTIKRFLKHHHSLERSAGKENIERNSTHEYLPW